MKSEIRQLSYKSTPTFVEEEGKKVLRGKIPFNSKSEWMGFYEIIAPSAFRKTLQEQDVKILVDHDSSKLLGRKANGTARFIEEPDGLLVEVDLPDTSYALDAWNLVKRNDVDTMSFGFEPIKVSERDNTRSLDEVKLFEISFCVPFPAYEATKSEALSRSWFTTRNINIEQLNDVLEKPKLTTDEMSLIKKVIEEISKKIEPLQDSVKEPVPSQPDTSLQDRLILEMEIENALN